MAKQRKKSEPFNYQEGLDQAFSRLLIEAKSAFGSDNVLDGTEAMQRMVGFPLPALCLRYLLQSPIFLFSRWMTLVGEERSGKSTLLYEIMRWFRIYGGRSALIEVETKDSPERRMQILNYDEKAVICRPCDSVEQWEQAVSYFHHQFQALAAGTPGRPGVGRIYPWCIGIDSLNGKGSEKSHQKLREDGFTSAQYSDIARKLSQFLQSFTHQLRDWPCALIGINHLKPVMQQGGVFNRGGPQWKTPGGKSILYQETTEIQLFGRGSVKRPGSGTTGNVVQMRTRKNSAGEDGIFIEATVFTWREPVQEVDPDTGEVIESIRKHTVWDWASASVNLLLRLSDSSNPAKGGTAAFRNKLKSFLDLHVQKKTGRMWSEALGIPESDPVPISMGGAIMEAHRPVMDQIHLLLALPDHRPFEPGIDLRSQWTMDTSTQMIRDRTWKILDSVRPSLLRNPGLTRDEGPDIAMDSAEESQEDKDA